MAGYWTLRLVAFSTLILMSLRALSSAEASPPLSPADDVHNEKEILRYLWPVLKSAGLAGRIDYQTSCSANENDPVFFPKIDLQPPSPSAVGLTAVQEIFKSNKTVEVTEETPGI